jgi:single-stranded-DNA-specific exonuclease
MQDNGDILTGSARSTDYFNITEAIGNFKDLLISFGGHFQAAGFNIKKENLEKFKSGMAEYAENKLKDTDLNPTLEIDCEIPDEEICFDFISSMDRLKPFGIGNKKPVFVLRNIEPVFVTQAGKTGDHLKFNININGKNIQTIGFNMGRFAKDFRNHKKIDLAFHLEKNNWKDRDYLNFHALDLELK